MLIMNFSRHRHPIKHNEQQNDFLQVTNRKIIKLFKSLIKYFLEYKKFHIKYD
jgi:hypothetical protein